jgi:hypothetical protein
MCMVLIYFVQVINILENSYKDMDVIFIQEAAASFVDHAKVCMCACIMYVSIKSLTQLLCSRTCESLYL